MAATRQGLQPRPTKSAACLLLAAALAIAYLAITQCGTQPQAADSQLLSQGRGPAQLDRTGVPVACFSPDEQTSPTSVILVLNNVDPRLHASLLCGIESAARMHEGIANHVLVYSPDIAAVEASLPAPLPPLTLCPADYRRAFKDTPLEAWHKDALDNSSRIAPINLADGFRLALLYKRGGLYIDTDILVLQQSLFTQHLGNLGTWLPLNDTFEHAINNAFLAFPAAGHLFLWGAMENFVQHYQGQVFGHQGPALLTRIARPCLAPEQGAAGPPAYCGGVTAWQAPEHNNNNGALIPPFLQTTELNSTILQRWAAIRSEWAYLHWFNSQYTNYHQHAFRMDGSSMLAVVFSNCCPSVFRTYHEQLTA